MASQSWKMVVLVVLLIAGTLSAVIWKTRSFLIADKLAFLADSSVKQIAPLKLLVHDRLEQAKVSLVHSATAHANNDPKHPHGKVDGEFDVVALLQPSEGGQWAPAWVDHNPNAKLDSLSNGLELTLLKSLPLAKIHDGETLWERLSDQQGRPVYAALISVEVQNPNGNQIPAAASLPDNVDYAPAGSSNTKRAVIVGLAMNNPLADITEEYIGAANTVFVVDDKGYIASHENKAYLGALFSEDPIVHEITSSHRLSASGKYEDLESRPVFGHYERIEHSNLYAVITTPTQAVTDMIDSYTKIALLVGGAGCAFGLLAAYLLGRKNGKGGDEAPVYTAPVVAVAAEVAPAVVAAASLPVAPVAPAANPFSAGFREAMKEPLLAILGHAQLARAKSGGNEDELRSHTESIEREARRAKDVLERIETFSKAERPSRLTEPMDLQKLVQQSMNLRESVFRDEEVELELDLKTVPAVRGSSEQLMVAIGNLVDNAVTAMRKRPKKQLKVQLTDEGDKGVAIRISDTGVGMTRDIRERAFEPFFKDFESEDGLGLGLSIVQSTLTELNGTCEIQSTPGEGATFILHFPVEDMDRALFRERERTRLSESWMAPIPTTGTSSGLEDVDDSELFREFRQPKEPPAGAHVAASFDDDEDEDEMFANVPLKTVTAQTTESESTEPELSFLSLQDEPAEPAAFEGLVEPAASEPELPSEPKDDSPFRVKIRRPRARS